MKKSKRIILAAIAFAFVLWIVIIALVPQSGKYPVTVEIPRGSTAGDIAGILTGKGVIRSAFGFKLLVRIKQSGAAMKPGAYKLDRSMTPSAIIDKIARGDAVSKWLTIPEGFTVRQVADRIGAEGFGSAGRFYMLAHDKGADFPTVFPHPGSSLEGYLFPDTYLISTGVTEEGIIRDMLDCFNRKAYQPLAGEIQASVVNLHDTITLASLIEREARIPKDRPLISAVLRNRLSQKMRLEVDATILYALGKHKDRVMYRDLEVDSPYNTYRNFGLPPGPIANPGMDAIMAAAHPAAADYLFYVAKPDGSHIFTKTFDEHRHAVAALRAKGGG